MSGQILRYFNTDTAAENRTATTVKTTVSARRRNMLHEGTASPGPHSKIWHLKGLRVHVSRMLDQNPENWDWAC